MKKYNFAIYGCGMIANIHADAIKSLDEAKLVAVADVNMSSATAFAQKHETAAYTDFNALLEDENIDVICLCTPNGTHAELALKALEYGKNVVTEKPMAITTGDCDRMIEATQKSSGKLMVISQLRTAPDIIKAKEIVESGVLGKIVLCDLHMKYYRSEEYYKGSWKGTLAMDGGGALMNQGIHGIDLLQYIVGPVKNIKSIVKTLVHNIEVEDTAVSAVEFENEALGVIEATTAAYPGFDREIKICGSKGYMEIRENCIEKLFVDGVMQDCEKYTSLGAASDPTKLAFREHANQFLTLIRVLNGEEAEYVNEYEGRKAVDIIARIYKAIKTPKCL